jgi:hypothetical protein
LKLIKIFALDAILAPSGKILTAPEKGGKSELQDDCELRLKPDGELTKNIV